jgi:hypothetical protein
MIILRAALTSCNKSQQTSPVAAQGGAGKDDLKDMRLLPSLSGGERRRVKAVRQSELQPTAAWPWVRAGVASVLNYVPD